MTVFGAVHAINLAYLSQQHSAYKILCITHVWMRVFGRTPDSWCRWRVSLLALLMTSSVDILPLPWACQPHSQACSTNILKHFLHTLIFGRSFHSMLPDTLEFIRIWQVFTDGRARVGGRSATSELKDGVDASIYGWYRKIADGANVP